MADYTFAGAQQAPEAGRKASLANILGAAASLALVVGVGVWGYGVMSRDVSGVPIVQAMSGPMRVAPENPGGDLADHQGLAVNQVAGSGSAAAPADRLTLAPRPAGLGEEDVALGAIIPQAQLDQPVPASLGDQPVSLAADDPIELLANQLASGVTPLQPLDPEPVSQPDAPVSIEDAIKDELLKTQPGLTRSLRPKTRPSNLRKTASIAPVVEAETTAVREIDPASLPAGTRLVQVGAFDSPETARKEWTKLEGKFGEYLAGKNRVIQRATSGGRVFYRLRAQGFDDLSDARRFCAAFVAQNVDCIPVVTR